MFDFHAGILTSDQELLVETTSSIPFLVRPLITLYVYRIIPSTLLTYCTNQSQASVSELNTTINHAKNKQRQGEGGSNQLKSLLSRIPSGTGGNMAADVDQMTAPPTKNPETMDPRELYANIWRILTIRDSCKFI
jgi:hypothetical protein